MVWVCKPILALSFGLSQAEQYKMFETFSDGMDERGRGTLFSIVIDMNYPTQEI